MKKDGHRLCAWIFHKDFHYPIVQNEEKFFKSCVCALLKKTTILKGFFHSSFLIIVVTAFGVLKENYLIVIASSSLNWRQFCLARRESFSDRLRLFETRNNALKCFLKFIDSMVQTSINAYLS